MSDLWVGLALILVIEGALYALFPDAMKRMMLAAQGIPSAIIRRGGLVAAVIGVFLVWVIRGF